jgi:hypothetical protein
MGINGRLKHTPLDGIIPHGANSSEIQAVIKLFTLDMFLSNSMIWNRMQ